MKLWQLKNKKPDWGYVDEGVVRAPTEAEARRILADNGPEPDRHIWLDANKSTCVELTVEGDAGVIVEVVQE